MTVVYYYDRDPLDVDNMLKPIQDALNQVVYLDDTQITDTRGSKRSLSGSFRVKGMGEALAKGFTHGSDFVYIRVQEAANMEELI